MKCLKNLIKHYSIAYNIVLIGGIRVEERLFDDVPEAREDYYMIVFECIKENILPFFKGLLSKLKTLNPTNVSKPKIKSTLDDYELIAFSLAKAPDIMGKP